MRLCTPLNSRAELSCIVEGRWGNHSAVLGAHAVQMPALVCFSLASGCTFSSLWYMTGHLAGSKPRRANKQAREWRS